MKMMTISYLRSEEAVRRQSARESVPFTRVALLVPTQVREYVPTRWRVGTQRYLCTLPKTALGPTVRSKHEVGPAAGRVVARDYVVRRKARPPC